MPSHGYCACPSCEEEMNRSGKVATVIKELLSRPPSPEETALAARQKQDAENLKTLHHYDARIADAQAVLNRYNSHVIGMGMVLGVTVGLMIGGATILSGAFSSVGWLLMFAGILGTLVIGARLGDTVFDAHRTQEKGPGHTISMHPAEVLRRIERDKLAWLDSKD